MGVGLGAFVLGRFTGRYSRDVQIPLLLGQIPIDAMREMCQSAEYSIIISSDLPLRVRAAYRDILSYFDRASRDLPITKVPVFQRARQLYDSIEKRMRMIDFHFKDDEIYMGQRKLLAKAS